jgi:hypothetical protein
LAPQERSETRGFRLRALFSGNDFRIPERFDGDVVGLSKLESEQNGSQQQLLVPLGGVDHRQGTLKRATTTTSARRHVVSDADKELKRVLE